MRTALLVLLLAQGASAYDTPTARAFVGAQHWNESGWYADQGFRQHYDGYFCLCSCEAAAEGVFCSGGGVKPDGVTKVADFLGVFAQQEVWVGTLAAFNTSTPFTDTFRLRSPGGPSNYTGVSQSDGPRSFVWRGYMSGVDCAYKDKCDHLCGDAPMFTEWRGTCEHRSGVLRPAVPLLRGAVSRLSRSSKAGSVIAHIRPQHATTDVPHPRANDVQVTVTGQLNASAFTDSPYSGIAAAQRATLTFQLNSRSFVSGSHNATASFSRGYVIDPATVSLTFGPSSQLTLVLSPINVSAPPVFAVANKTTCTCLGGSATTPAAASGFWISTNATSFSGGVGMVAKGSAPGNLMLDMQIYFDPGALRTVGIDDLKGEYPVKAFQNCTSGGISFQKNAWFQLYQTTPANPVTLINITSIAVQGLDTVKTDL